MAALKRRIFDFLNPIFEPTRYHANATLRGFYFTSGTQEGTPIDQLIGALARSFGAEEVAGACLFGQGQELLPHRPDPQGDHRRGGLGLDRSAGGAARADPQGGGLSPASSRSPPPRSTAWWISYSHNRDLIAQTDNAIEAYRAAAGPLATRNDHLRPRLRTRSSRCCTGCATCRPAMRAAERRCRSPRTFGLSQRERLQSSSENAYRIALERMFRPRLMFRLEELLEANRNDAGFRLRGAEGLPDARRPAAGRPRTRSAWMRRDWADNLYPGAGNAGGRKALEEHLVAMLDLEAGNEPLFTLHGPLIEETQKTLARLSVAQRAYELLKSQARSAALPDWVAGAQRRPGLRARVRARSATRTSKAYACPASSPMRASSAASSNGSATSPNR